MLQRHLSESSCRTLQVEGDADVLIVKTAVDSAMTHPTVLAGSDTYLLVLLCCLTKADGNDLYFRPEPEANFRESRVWNMLKVKAELGPAVCRNMLCLHVILGCETTSRPYGIKKPRPLNNVVNLFTSKIKRRYSTSRDQLKPKLRQRERML